jgi:hypothetical protein
VSTRQSNTDERGGSEEKLLRVSLATASVVRQTKLTMREGSGRRRRLVGKAEIIHCAVRAVILDFRLLLLKFVQC